MKTTSKLAVDATKKVSTWQADLKEVIDCIGKKSVPNKVTTQSLIVKVSNGQISKSQR